MKNLWFTVALVFMALNICNAQTLDKVACKKLGETVIEKQSGLSYAESNELYGNDFIEFCNCFYDKTFKSKAPEKMMRILAYIATFQADENSNNFHKLASLYRLKMNEPQNAKIYNRITAVINKPVNPQNYEQDLLPIADAMGLVDNELMMAKQLVAAQIAQLPPNATYENLMANIIYNFTRK